MSRRLEELFNTYAYDSRQKNQLRLADEKGLDIERIKNPKYDWEQMREIALCMEYGVDPTPLCNPALSSEDMEYIRTHLFNQQSIFEDAKQSLHQKRIKSIITLAIFVILIASLSYLAFIKRETILSYMEEVPLVLTSEHIEIEYGESLYLSDYVKEYNHNQKLILPELQEMDELKDYVYEFKATNGTKTTTKELIVSVVDTTKPELSLKQQTVTIYVSDKFNPKDYISNTSDNYDTLTADDVLIESQVNTSKAGTYKVGYTLKDQRGNVATSEISVAVKEKHQVQQAQPSNPSNTKPSNSTSQPAKPQTTVKSQTKIFLISSYNYDITSCKSAALNYLNSTMGSVKGSITGYLEPYIEDGVTKGYQVCFKY